MILDNTAKGEVKMEPKILISGSRGKRDNYEQAVRLAGGLPCSDYCPAYDDCFSGLLLGGGEDIEPALFGQENRGSLDIDPARDRAELALVRAFLQAGKPILAICRGHQVVNVALGGDLIQDISPALHAFHTRDSGCKEDKIHPVRTAENSLLRQLMGPAFPVTSAHHQAVDRLGDGLIATAWSESGLVEAMERPDLPLLCVQFHPERMCGVWSRSDKADGLPLFRWLIARSVYYFGN